MGQPYSSYKNLIKLIYYDQKKLIHAATKKLRLSGLALAFQNPRPGQSHHEAVFTARLGLAYLGLAWPGSRPQAGPGKALPAILRVHWHLAHKSSTSIWSYLILKSLFKDAFRPSNS